MSKESKLFVSNFNAKVEQLFRNNDVAFLGTEVAFMITKKELREALGLRFLRDATIRDVVRELNELKLVQNASKETDWDDWYNSLKIYVSPFRRTVRMTLKKLNQSKASAKK